MWIGNNEVFFFFKDVLDVSGDISLTNPWSLMIKTVEIQGWLLINFPLHPVSNHFRKPAVISRVILSTSDFWGFKDWKYSSSKYFLWLLWCPQKPKFYVDGVSWWFNLLCPFVRSAKHLAESLFLYCCLNWLKQCYASQTGNNNVAVRFTLWKVTTDLGASGLGRAYLGERQQWLLKKILSCMYTVPFLFKTFPHTLYNFFLTFEV